MYVYPSTQLVEIRSYKMIATVHNNTICKVHLASVTALYHKRSTVLQYFKLLFYKMCVQEWFLQTWSLLHLEVFPYT